MKRSGMYGTVCPPVCPAASRGSTTAHSCSRHSAVTSAVGSARWKRTTCTLWSRRARSARLAHT